MNVILSPIPDRGFSVGAAADPYKKYWWAILAGFIGTAAWLCFPIMETPVGSVHVDAKPAVDAASVEQSLDSADGPDGAPGGALDLSMDGVKRQSKSGDDDMTSMLYQAPSEAGAAAGKPLGDATAASAASLAQQLKDAGKKIDASGWAEKAQRGFTVPHLEGALSGSGSAGGGSSASASASGGNYFGSRNAQVGFVATRGLHDDGGADSPGFRALKSAGAAAAPSLAGSNEAMRAGMSQAFDGANGKAPAKIGMGAMAQANAALSAAPANLKMKDNNPQLDSKKLPNPPAAPTPASASQNMGQQLAMMAATTLIGGLVGGVTGQMGMMMGTMMTQQQQAATAQSSATTAARLTPSS